MRNKHKDGVIKRNIISKMRKVYLEDKRIYYVSYSGGKDSTTVLALTMEMLLSIPLKERNKIIYVLMSDTKVELPPVIQQITKQINQFKTFVKEHALPVVFDVVIPTIKDSFFSMVIGKGYPLPSSSRRYCTDRMKIKPMQEQVEIVHNTVGDFIAVTGSRKDESKEREKHLNDSTVNGEFLKTHTFKKGCSLMCPIEDWSTEEVWEYLMEYSDNKKWIDRKGLALIYSEAAGDGDECTTVLYGGAEAQKPSCSKSSRFGCWTCTLLKGTDKSLTNLSKGHGYLSHMNEYRNWLVSYRDGLWHEVRDVYNHANHAQVMYTRDNARLGMAGPGGFTLDFRKIMLTKLLETEKNINEEGADLRLISDEELQYIQEIWAKEGDIELSCVTMAAKFNRNVKVSKKLSKKVTLTEELIKILPLFEDEVLQEHGMCVNERFCSQFVEIFSKDESIRQIDRRITLIKNYLVQRDKGKLDWFMKNPILQMIGDTKLVKQFYPSDAQEELIRKEWQRDKVWLHTSIVLDNCEALNISIEGNLATKLKIEEANNSENYDVAEDSTLSIDEQMAMFENYREEDATARRNQNNFAYKEKRKMSTGNKVTAMVKSKRINNPDFAREEVFNDGLFKYTN